MPNKLLWDAAPVSRGNVLSTELNSLANDARTNAGTEVDNSINLDQYGYLELNITFGSAPSGTNPHIAIYRVMALDGTNYADGSSSVAPGDDTWVINIPVRAVTTAQNKQIGPFLLPGAKQKYIALNKAGVAFPASGSTIELFVQNDEMQ